MATPTTPVISDYANGVFTIGEGVHHGSMLITGEDDIGFSITSWPVNNDDDLTAASLDPIYNSDNRPMLIVLGVGATMTHPYAKLRAELSSRGIAVEIQTTPAACRTWNLLLSEGRKVSLAVIALPAAISAATHEDSPAIKG